MSLHALANDMASKGRYGDSMLVHMSPNEVAGLHALALHHGEKLTINPQTGLPEAFKLKSLLPAILGAVLAPLTAGTSLAFLGATPFASALTVGAGFGLAKGSLKEGLLAGLGAFGGAGLAQSLGAAGVSEAAAQEAFKKSTVEDAIRMDMQERALTNAATNTATNTASTAGTTAATAPAATAPAATAPATGLGTAGTPVSTATPMPSIPGEEITRAMGSPAAYAPPTGLEALSKGAQSIYDKGTFGEFAKAKANKRALYSIGASALMSPENEEEMPETQRDPGYIRPARYDWRTGKYEYFEPVKASEWGTRNLSEYTNPNDPNARTPIGRKDGGLMALANGGAIAFADGGPAFTTGQGSSPASTEPRDPINSLGLPVTPRPGEPGSAEAREAALARQNAELEERKARRAAFAASGLPNQFVLSGHGPEGGAYNADTGESMKPYIYADGKYTDPNAGSATNITGGGGSGSGAAVSQSSAGLPYITPEAPNTSGATGARNMDAGWASYYDNSKPGDVWSFAGGTLTRNADGSATFVGPDGKRNTFNRNTPYSEVAKNAPSIAAKWAEDYGYTPTTPTEPKKPTDPYNPDPKVPVTRPISEVTSGGSRAAYEYLYGQGPYPVNPYLPPNTPIAKPIYETPGYEALKPKPSASLYSSNKDIKPTGNPGTGNEWVWKEDQKKWVSEKIGSNNDAPPPALPELAGANGGMVKHMALGGLGSLAGGGQAGYNLGGYSDGGRLLRGPGDGVSDSIPATIGRRQPARLADGEFVVPARIVSELGNGSTEAGARKLYAMMDRVQRARGKTTGKKRVAVNSRAEKYLPA